MFASLILTLVASATAALAGPLARAGLRRQTTDCPGYSASNVVKTDSTLTADLKLAGTACNAYGQDLDDLKLLVEYQTNDRLHIKIYDAALNVYQVPESFMPRPASQNASSSAAAIQFSLVESPFSFSVTRTNTNETLFDTSGVNSSLIFESQYVRLRTQLPLSPNLYGLGEHSDSFRLETTNYQRTLWNSESPFIPRHSNLYGSHPMYFDHRGSAGTHGVFLLSSDGMNININNSPTEGQYLEYNTNGGIIDLYIMAGPKASDVSKQYAEVVGLPAMMPYWTFGFHQCKYGYFDVLDVAEVVGNYSIAGIPLETMWTDIDYMNLRQDFTTDPERFPMHKMRELVSTLHGRDQHYIVILDPGIHATSNYAPYSDGVSQDVFLKNSTGEYLGVDWPGVVVYPDWFASNTQQWWTNQFARFFNADSGLDIDAVWVDMNEASNFCSYGCDPYGTASQGNDPPQPTSTPRNNTGRVIPGFPSDFQPPTSSKSKRQSAGSMTGLSGRDLLNPPYRINNHRGRLSDYTIYTDVINANGIAQYDTHNVYGTMNAFASREAMLSRRPGRRPMVLTRSTFAGAGTKVAHWFGDNDSNWDDYRISIAQMLAFTSMFQMPMVGSDVCGFNGATDDKLCSRWATLGAFYPFYRNHADISAPSQEFYRWPLVTAAAKNAIDTRYKLLDYIYTALYRQTQDGTPLIKPLFFEYPTDPNTFGIDLQYFYGDSLLICPVTDANSTAVSFYLPDDLFYDYRTFAAVRGNGSMVTLTNVDYTTIPVYMKGGSIIPIRANSANTTTALRQQNFNVIIAPGLDGKATGSLYLDDGDSLVQQGITDINFYWDGKSLTSNGTYGYQGGSKREAGVVVESMIILGQKGAINGTAMFKSTGATTVTGPWGLTGPFEVTPGR